MNNYVYVLSIAWYMDDSLILGVYGSRGRAEAAMNCSFKNLFVAVEEDVSLVEGNKGQTCWRYKINRNGRESGTRYIIERFEVDENYVEDM